MLHWERRPSRDRKIWAFSFCTLSLFFFISMCYQKNFLLVSSLLASNKILSLPTAFHTTKCWETLTERTKGILVHDTAWWEIQLPKNKKLSLHFLHYHNFWSWDIVRFIFLTIFLSLLREVIENSMTFGLIGSRVIRSSKSII